MSNKEEQMETNQFEMLMQGYKEIAEALVRFGRVVAEYQLTVTTAIVQINGELAKMNSQLDRIITEKPGMPL